MYIPVLPKQDLSLQREFTAVSVVLDPEYLYEQTSLEVCSARYRVSRRCVQSW